MILVCKYWFKIAYESDSKLYAFDTQLTVHNFIKYMENILRIDFQIGEEYEIEIVESGEKNGEKDREKGKAINICDYNEQAVIGVMFGTSNTFYVRKIRIVTRI